MFEVIQIFRIITPQTYTVELTFDDMANDNLQCLNSFYSFMHNLYQNQVQIHNLFQTS